MTRSVRGRIRLMQTNWPSEHADALREYVAKGMSYAEIADAINAKFKTSYSRNAAIGRAKRMGLAGPDQDLPKHCHPRRKTRHHGLANPANAMHPSSGGRCR